MESPRPFLLELFDAAAAHQRLEQLLARFSAAQLPRSRLHDVGTDRPVQLFFTPLSSRRIGRFGANALVAGDRLALHSGIFGKKSLQSRAL